MHYSSRAVPLDYPTQPDHQPCRASDGHKAAQALPPKEEPSVLAGRARCLFFSVTRRAPFPCVCLREHEKRCRTRPAKIHPRQREAPSFPAPVSTVRFSYRMQGEGCCRENVVAACSLPSLLSCCVGRLSPSFIDVCRASRHPSEHPHAARCRCYCLKRCRFAPYQVRCVQNARHSQQSVVANKATRQPACHLFGDPNA